MMQLIFRDYDDVKYVKPTEFKDGRKLRREKRAKKVKNKYGLTK